MLVALLTICAISAPTEPPEALATAPELPPWPPSLSEPREGVEGTLLPPDLAEATVARLVACQALPGRCQKRLDALWGGCRALVDGAVEVGRADALGARVEARATVGGRIETWQALLGGAVLVILAGGVGYLAGRLTP